MNLEDDPANKAVALQAPTYLQYKEFAGLQAHLMIPDKGFTKQLHILDPEYEVAWDWGAEKWEIWKFPKDGSEAYHVLTVQTKDRTYRELGADVLLQLQKGDPARFSAGQFVKYFEEMDNQLRRRKMKDFRNLIRDIAMDSFINLHCKIIQVPEQISVGRSVSCQT